MDMASGTNAPETKDLHRVEVSFPADARMLFLARMTAAGVATCAELNYEQVEDLRLAVDELCIALLACGDGAGRISLHFQWNPDWALEVVGTLVTEGDASSNGHAPDRALPSLSFDLSTQILDALVDDHGTDETGGVRRAWLRVRRHALSL
jgi:hypothetical protein